MQPSYRDNTTSVIASKKLYESGELNELQGLLWSPIRMPEELYDLGNETDDKGQYPESVDSLRGVLVQYPVEAVNPAYDKARQ